VEGVYRPQYAIKPHRHLVSHCTYVFRGSFCERRFGQSQEHHGGDLLFHPAGEVHSDLIGRNGAHCLNIEFIAADPLPVALNAICSRSDSFQMRLAETDSVEMNLLLGMSRDARTKPFAGGEADSQSGKDLRQFQLRIRKRVWDTVSETLPNWLNECLKQLDQSVSDSTRIRELARSVRVHPTHFARVCRQRLGQTFGELVHRHRVTKACDLLQQSSLSLAAVAIECGFFDQAHFTRVFRRFIGATPGQCRANTSSSLADC
jgi:AraC-like DNA-binding protein